MEYWRHLCIGLFSLCVVSGCNDDGGNTRIRFTGNPMGSEIHVPDDVPSINDAIFAAKPGDTIVVSRGEFNEDVTLKERVNIRGNFAETILRGQIIGNKISEATHITGLQIMESNITAELTDSSVCFERCTFLGGTLELLGNGTPLFKNCTFDGLTNTKSGVLVGGGEPTFERCIFEFWDTAVFGPSSINPIGTITDCIFFKNRTNTRGIWNGMTHIFLGDPRHTNRIDGEYYLDNGSPAILKAGTEFIGAWKPARFLARPRVMANRVSGAPIGGVNVLTRVLELSVSASGKNPMEKIKVNELILRVRTNRSVKAPLDWVVLEALPGGGSRVLEWSYRPVLMGSLILPLNNFEVRVGDAKIIRVFVNLYFHMNSGDTFELYIDSMRWSDGGGLWNTNGQDIGLPLRGGELKVP